MSKKRLRTKAWPVTSCAIIFLTSLFLYWHAVERSAREPIATLLKPAAAPRVAPISTPLPSQEHATETPPMITEKKEAPPAETHTPDAEEIAKAIDFLETLEEQSHPEKVAEAESEESESTTELSQAEMFQLVREGVSYYDSLLESGSVDFFLQTSSVDYPGVPRAPSGTWEGTFEFSGSRVRATVMEDVIQYDPNRPRTI